MSRYHLNLHNSVGFVPDEEGSEFSDLEHARASAVASVRSILSDEISRGSLDMRGRIDIADNDGVLITVVRFSDAVHLQLEGEPT